MNYVKKKYKIESDLKTHDVRYHMKKELKMSTVVDIVLKHIQMKYS